MSEVMTGSVSAGLPGLESMILCTVCSLLFGLVVAAAYRFRSPYSKSLAATLVLIPAIVQMIIMLVNGNIGAGVAVAGAFSLVRFRSVPGSARDIGFLFFAMAIGFVTGMGYLFYALVFLLLIGGACVLLAYTGFGRSETDDRILRITIPENLDYDELFDDILVKYTRKAELEKVKTSNMGSLYELTYRVQLKTDAIPKSFLDELRCRNGNLNIWISREQHDGEEL
ncbi:MAG: DUF4956 domain-containing protein [Clostridiales bacterium]|nr:DUF4956 domain-containing protein [Clostridiales bacterium]